MYAMCIINVSKELANPQIETGNRIYCYFKIKWYSLGSSEIMKNGVLGNGTQEVSNELTKVKIDEDTDLENIIKIAVRNRSYFSINKYWPCLCMGRKWKRTAWYK
jgi:hypothetical protein